MNNIFSSYEIFANITSNSMEVSCRVNFLKFYVSENSSNVSVFYVLWL